MSDGYKSGIIPTMYNAGHTYTHTKRMDKNVNIMEVKKPALRQERGRPLLIF